MIRSFFSVLTVTTVFCLGYVQQRVMLVEDGYRVERLRQLKDELLDQHRVLHYNVLTLRSPVILSKRLERRDIQLNPPQQIEVLRAEAIQSPVSTQRAQASGRPMWLQLARKAATSILGINRQAQAKPAHEE
ncbi:MAG: hypothetical protein NC910_04185 [Candidatus Omnitrophica bacterium]|nr:hypothetical protein [Candidatus Omnitrophota bacterium]